MNEKAASAAPCNQQHELAVDAQQLERHQKQVVSVLLLTCVTMVIEIAAGHITGSMALQADGYHMASHAGALGVAYVAYRMMTWERVRARMNFGSGKILSLGGYSSAIALGFVAVWMMFESIERLFSPKNISFNEALSVAVLGLVVNLLSAWLLGWGSGVGHHHHHPAHGHEHEHSHDGQQCAQRHHQDTHAHHHHAHSTDHNHQAALVHVLADALTSVLAIVALLVARQFPSAAWLDPVMGIVGGLVILRWAWSLLKQTAVELLDFYPSGVSLSALKAQIEKDGHRVWDLHVWSQGRGALVGMLSVTPAHPEEDFRKYFRSHGRAIHLSVERVSCTHK